MIDQFCVFNSYSNACFSEKYEVLPEVPKTEAYLSLKYKKCSVGWCLEYSIKDLAPDFSTANGLKHL